MKFRHLIPFGMFCREANISEGKWEVPAWYTGTRIKGYTGFRENSLFKLLKGERN